MVDEPDYWHAETDEVARLVDAMPEDVRLFVLDFVRLAAARLLPQAQAGEPATASAWGELTERNRLRHAERVQSERAARKAHRRIADTPYLLSGVVWCVQCNRPMRINTTRDSRRPHQPLRSYLRCDTRAHPHWSLRASDVLLYVRHEMTRLTAADIDRIVAADTGSERTQAAIDAARRTLTRLARSLADADDDRYLHGTLDADRHARTVARLRTEIANQEAELARLEAARQHEAEAGGRRARLLEVLSNGAAVLEDADPTRAIVVLGA